MGSQGLKDPGHSQSHILTAGPIQAQGWDTGHLGQCGLKAPVTMTDSLWVGLILSTLPSSGQNHRG